MNRGWVLNTSSSSSSSSSSFFFFFSFFLFVAAASVAASDAAAAAAAAVAFLIFFGHLLGRYECLLAVDSNLLKFVGLYDNSFDRGSKFRPHFLKNGGL